VRPDNGGQSDLFDTVITILILNLAPVQLLLHEIQATPMARSFVFACATAALAARAIPTPPVLSPVGGVVYDLLNSDEDVAVQVTQMQDTDRSVTTYATPSGNYTMLVRNDLSRVFMVYPQLGALVCIPFDTTMPIAPLSFAPFQYSSQVFFAEGLANHFRFSVGDALIGLVASADTGLPLLVSNPANQQQAMIFSKVLNGTVPPSSLFNVPEVCSSATVVKRSEPLNDLSLDWWCSKDPEELWNDARDLVERHNSSPGAQYRLTAGVPMRGAGFWPSLEAVCSTRLTTPGALTVPDRVRTYRPPHGFRADANVDHSSFATPVRNQGTCGMCWAFSTSATLEVAVAFAQNTSVQWLAPQSLADCIPHDYVPNAQLECKGCLGGNPFIAMGFVNQSGIAHEADYPYRAVNQLQCAREEPELVYPIRDYLVSPMGNATAMAAAVSEHGAVTAIINVLFDFVMYEGGVYNNPKCTGDRLSHAVTVVGYGTDQETPYWLVKNSFGRQWGEAGYFRMARGINMCGIENYVAVPVV
jgi:hypothetical protein